MKVAIIDIQSQTYNYLQATKSNLGDFVHIKCKESEDLSVIAKKTKEGSFDVILINIECNYENSKRSDLKGIELIYWLRLKENYLGTIITYGFLSSAQILRLKPEYVVLHAPGNYHFRLPDEISSINEYLGFGNISNIDDYKKYLKPFINIQAIRHSSANYYALKRIKELHYHISGESLAIVEPKLTTTELVYDTIFSSDIEVGLAKEAEQFIEQEIEEIENELSILKEKLVPKGNKGQRQGRAIDLLKNYTEVLDSMAKSNVNYSVILGLKIQNKNIVNGIKANILKLEQQINEKNNLIQNKYQTLITQQRKDNLNSKLTKLRALKGILVLVDDLADKGWKNVYKGIVGSSISTIKENIPNSIKEFDALQLASSILEKQPNVILLDMRLFESEENIYYPSGIKVLIELRKLNAIVPIIVCSASNRGTIINKVHQLGADFYWVKEGADLEFGFDESIKNYEKLIEYLQTSLSNEQYKIQKLYHQFQEKLVTSETPHWWEKKDWFYEHYVVSKGNTMKQIIVERETKVHNPDVIIEIISNAIKNISTELIKATISNTNSDWTFCSKIISDLGNIIEIVHRFDVIKSHIDSVRKDEINYTYIRDVGSGNIAHKKKGQYFGRNDKQGKYLYNHRNRAAHYQTAKQIKMFNVLDYLERMLNYLIEPNTTTNEKIIFEKEGKYYKDQKCETGWFKKNKKTR